MKTKNGYFNRDALLAKLAERKKREMRRLEVPEWGATVYIPDLSAREAMKLAKIAKEIKDDGDLERNTEAACKLLANWLRDEKGEPLLTEEEAPGVLMDESNTLVQRLITQASELVNPPSTETTAKN